MCSFWLALNFECIDYCLNDSNRRKLWLKVDYLVHKCFPFKIPNIWPLSSPTLKNIISIRHVWWIQQLDTVKVDVNGWNTWINSKNTEYSWQHLKWQHYEFMLATENEGADCKRRIVEISSFYSRNCDALIQHSLMKWHILNLFSIPKLSITSSDRYFIDAEQCLSVAALWLYTIQNNNFVNEYNEIIYTKSLT